MTSENAGRVVFRASASGAIGGGHVIRCLALADALKAEGWMCTFASAPESTLTAPTLGDYPIIEIDETLSEAAQSAIIGAAVEGADICIVDHYGLGADFETAARAWAAKIVVFEDVPARRHDADLLLDASGGRRAEAYTDQKLLPDTCMVLAGPRYALLRDAFALDAAPRASGPGLWRIFVSMGATDPDNLTGEALTVLAATLPDVEIDVMLSAAAPHLAALRATEMAGVTVHAGVSDVARLMAGADLAIGTAGINLWERCALGVPSLLVIAAENQRDNAHFAEAAGAAMIVGEEGVLSGEALEHALKDLARAPERLDAMRLAALDVCDGMGAKRVADAIAALMRIG